MSKLANGKIYEIVCEISGKRYVGSTCQEKLSQRLAGHVSYYKRYLNNQGTAKYSSYEVLERGKYYISLLELVDCDNRDVLLARERHFINTLECVNKYRAGQMLGKTIGEYQKEYKQENVEKIKAYYLKNAEANICECGGKVSVHNKAQHERTDRHYTWMNEKLCPSVENFIDLTNGIKIGEIVEDYSHNLLSL